MRKCLVGLAVPRVASLRTSPCLTVDPFLAEVAIPFVVRAGSSCSGVQSEKAHVQDQVHQLQRGADEKRQCQVARMEQHASHRGADGARQLQ